MNPITDPELASGLEAFEQALEGGIGLTDIEETRQYLAGLSAAMAAEAPVILGVVASDHLAPGSEGDPDMIVRVYQPKDGPIRYLRCSGFTAGAMSSEVSSLMI